MNTACSCEPIHPLVLEQKTGRHPNVWNSPFVGVDVGGSGISAAGAAFPPPKWRERRFGGNRAPTSRRNGGNRVARMAGPPLPAPAATMVSSPRGSVAPFPMAAKQLCGASPAAPRAAPSLSLSVTGAAIPGAVRRMVVTPSPLYEGVQDTPHFPHLWEGPDPSTT
ncbi:unnamed protein product [Lampetra fluviatilis]